MYIHTHAVAARIKSERFIDSTLAFYASRCALGIIFRVCTHRRSFYSVEMSLFSHLGGVVFVHIECVSGYIFQYFHKYQRPHLNGHYVIDRARYRIFAVEYRIALSLSLCEPFALIH